MSTSADMAVEIKDLRKALDDTSNAFSEFKEAVNKGNAERKQFGDQLGLTKEKLDKIEKTFQSYDQAWEKKRAEDAAKEALEAQKIATLESAIVELKRPGAERLEGKLKIKPGLEKWFSEEKSFLKFLSVGEEYMAAEERKGLATDSDAAGGFLTTHEISSTIIELNVLYSPIRQISTVFTISKGDTLEIPREGATAFAVDWVGERAARTETTSGNFANAKIPTHELGANPWATQKMLDDSAFDVPGYMSRKVGQQFGRKEGEAFVSGSGVGRPQGIANGSSQTLVVTASNLPTANLLIDLQHLLEEPYASMGTWVSKRATFGKIRQLTATTDNFLWQPGLSAGDPPTLLGRPYIACNDVDALGSSGNKVIYFGDFKAGYYIVDRLGISVLRDPFTNKPNVEFTHYKRVGGQVVLPEAIKIGTNN